jgi:hypothetical protein
MIRSRLIAVSSFVASCWLVSGGCSSDSGGGSSGTNVAGSGGVPGGGSGGSSPVTLAGNAGNGGTGKSPLNPLCGVADEVGECVPDEASACLDYVPPQAAGGEAAGGAPGTMPSANGEAGGQAGDAAGGAAQAGAPGTEGGAGPNGLAGAPGAGAGGEGGQGAPMPGLPSYSCQVTSQGNLLTRQCVPAGSGTANAPCFSAADCAPSFACVTDGEAGRCLPYCCYASTVCAPGTYCAEQPLRRSPNSVTSDAAPRVPVCVPADGCSLEDKFPCPAGKDCRCKNDMACMVVRDDGTTACVKPGTGQQGDACPCAWNHVCSSVTHQCVKICRTDSVDGDCGTQKCQASAELPPNFGVCVGPLP